MAYKRVYSTFRQVDLGFIKSILEGNSIKFYVANENIAGIYPMGFPMDVMVIDEQAEEAEKIIKAYKVPPNE